MCAPGASSEAVRLGLGAKADFSDEGVSRPPPRTDFLKAGWGRGALLNANFFLPALLLPKFPTGKAALGTRGLVGQILLCGLPLASVPALK